MGSSLYFRFPKNRALPFAFPLAGYTPPMADPGVYTQRFNRRHRRVGHVFQGRYKAILVQKDSYLLELARYIVLNPLRARMVKRVPDWPWSSYRTTAGFAQAPDWLDTDWILSAFGQRKSRARERYRAFVAEGKNQPSPWGATAESNLPRQRRVRGQHAAPSFTGQGLKRSPGGAAPPAGQAAESLCAHLPGPGRSHPRSL